MPARSSPPPPARGADQSTPARRRVRIKRREQAGKPAPSGDSPKHHGEKLGKAVREAARPTDLVEDEP